MIISFPTALYANVIPVPQGTGNVTWLISSTDPPRSTTSFQQIPPGELTRQKVPISDDGPRRRAMGDAVFSISQGAQSTVGSIKLQFEIGQILDFTSEELAVVTTANVPQMVDLQQNTNLLDLSSLGLTDLEIVQVTEVSEQTKKQLEGEIVALQQNITNVSVAINENQKQINEANKVLDAVTVIGDAGLITKMNAKIADLSTQRDALIATLNAYNEAVGVKFDDLLKVIQLVR